MAKYKTFSAIVVFFALPALFGALELKGNYEWQNAKTLCPGIKYREFKFTSPRLIRFTVARIDLKNPKFCFMVTGRDRDWGKAMPDFPEMTIRTKRITCREFMLNAVNNGKNMVLAVNGSPWRPWTKPFNHKFAAGQGLMISDGVLVAEADGRPSFIVRNDGSCDFALFPADTPADKLKNIRHAISGFSYALRDGEMAVDDKPEVLAPRTGYGLDKERRYLYITVIDGRQKKYSMGASVYEVGEVLKYIGAEDGLNMDGGGSTTLLVRKKKKIIKLNHHSGDSERKVGGAMGICIID